MRLAVLTLAIFIAGTLQAKAQDTTSALCKILSNHTSAKGVAYESGVDVHGKPVVPADYNNGGPSMVPDVVKIPLTVDLARRLNGPLPAGTQLETVMGNLEIRKDGTVTYNGKDMTPQANVLCGRAPSIPATSAATQPPQPVAPPKKLIDVPPPILPPPPPPGAFIKTPGAKQTDLQPPADFKTAPGTLMPEAEADEETPPMPTITIQEGKGIQKKNIEWKQGK
jgi:hypothetical protein